MEALQKADDISPLCTELCPAQPQLVFLFIPSLSVYIPLNDQDRKVTLAERGTEEAAQQKCKNSIKWTSKQGRVGQRSNQNLLLVDLGKVSIKKDIKSYGIFHTGWGGLPNFHNFFRRKKMFFS